MNSSNLRYHYLGDCFKPKKDFFSKHTWFSLPGASLPSCWIMKIFSQSSSYKKVVLTSSCSNFKFYTTVKANNTLIDARLAIGEKVSLKLTPSLWVNPLATNLALNLLSSTTVIHFLIMYIHLQLTILLFLDLLTNS